MKRHIYDKILADLKQKMVFITGPRQVGKTYLAKMLMKEYRNPQYLNFDNVEDARIIRSRSWPINNDLLILDEIHKMKFWKKHLKGIYDSKNLEQSILVTGSSRMDTFRQGGESLAGRYFHYRLLPISVKEFDISLSPFDKLEAIMRLGGFPEPLLSGSEEFAARWRSQYYTDLIREDIIEFDRVQEIKSMKFLLETLRERVGAPISYAALARDLGISPVTVKKYIDILEALYIIFTVRPYSKKIARSIVKEPKVYFYDTGYVKADKGRIFENACAVCLQKHIFYLIDSQGQNTSLNYIKTKSGQEVDFVLVKDDVVTHIGEAKLSDNSISSSLRNFSRKLPDAVSIQLVHNLKKEEYIGGVSVRLASEWLNDLSA